MAAQRPSKDRVRQYWVEECEDLDPHCAVAGVPLFLTLPGALGLDIKLLMQAGLIEATPVGGVATASASKVVAVEQDAEAVLRLQVEIPGLEILEMNVDSLVRGVGPYQWPSTPSERRACRALMINLDYNMSIRASTSGTALLDLPVVGVIRKFAQLHAAPTPVPEWSLGLTLNSETTNWVDDTWRAAVELLASNFQEVPAFRATAVAFVGETGVTAVEARTIPAFADAPGEELRRRLLMALIPKKVIDAVRPIGWSTIVRHNVQYATGDGTHAMLSWVFRFRWDAQTGTQPIEAYRKGVATVFAQAEVL